MKFPSPKKIAVEYPLNSFSRDTSVNGLPTIVILEADGGQSPPVGRHAVTYARELISLTADPDVRSPPRLEGTESVVPAPPPPSDVPRLPAYPPLPLGDGGDGGNVVLLVVPTANAAKMALVRECVVAALAPPGVDLRLVVVPASSGVGEQPYDGAGLAGACIRIRNALARLQDGDDVAIAAPTGVGTILVASIESYIRLPPGFSASPSPHPSSPSSSSSSPAAVAATTITRPSDFGLVVVYNATTSRASVAVSRGVTIAPRFVRRALRFGAAVASSSAYPGSPTPLNGGRVTVGAVVAARGAPVENGHAIDKADWHRVVAGRSRYELLREAMMGMEIPW